MKNKKLTELLMEKLRGTSKSKTVHWNDLTEEFVDVGRYGRSELISAMNSILMPCGIVTGMNHNYFIGKPED